MAWRDTLQQGSLDGAKFLTERSELTPGRKIAVYDSPFGDGTVTSIDLGKKPLRFVLDAVFVGETYNEARDAFLKVVNKAGPKELVHPFYGRLYVIPDPDAPITLTEDPNLDGGCATVKMTFLRHRAPSTSASNIGKALGTAAAMKKAGLDLGAAIESAMSATDIVDDFVAAASVETLDDMLSDMQALNGDIDALLATPGNLASQISSISGELLELLSTPSKLFSAIDGAQAIIADSFAQLLPEDRKQSVASTDRAISQMAALGAQSESGVIPDIDTPTRKQQRETKALFLLGFRASGVRRVTDALADNPPDNATDARRNARKARAALTSVLETSIDGAELDPNIRKALTRYRTAAVAHLEAQAGSLNALQSWVPPETLPCEVIAWTVYGDARRADEVAARAEAEHPGFIAGQVPIELLAS